MHELIGFFATFVVHTIEATGYAGIAFLMALESMNVPIPSEIIMPFSGFLAFNEKFNLLWVIIFGTAGNVIGSVISYYIGYFGGRPFVEKYGKFLFIKRSDIGFSETFFQKYGTFAILLGRMLPIVRTFISLPAGLARMNIWKFIAYTAAGSFLWCDILAYGGSVAGSQWNILEPYFQKFDWIILLLVVGGASWWIVRHMFFRQEKTP